MSIHLLPELSINGLGGRLGFPFFGGYIYDLNYNVSVGSEGSSSVSVSLVNETGNYNFNQSNLSVTTSYNITVGPLNFLMYPTRVRKRYSSRGNLVEIEFSDGSFKLDKCFVGLHKKHGWNYRLGSAAAPYGSNPSCFVIVGREFHPCDINFDGNVNVIGDIKDPCHPCQQEANQANQARLVECQNMSKFNIFDVKYNFSELIQALSGRFQFANATDPNPTYYREHTGSVREVLSAWCHHFGWIFFWDNGVIRFKDLRTVPVVNATIQNFCPDIENYEEEYSLDGTFDKMVLTNFTRQGIDNDFDCYNAVGITIPSYSQTSVPASNLDIDSSIDYDAAGLAYYGKPLRDLYHLFIKHKMTGPEKYYPGKVLPELGLQILTDAITLNASSVSTLKTSVIESSTTLDKPSFSHYRTSIDEEAVTSGLGFLEEGTDVGELSSVKDAIKANPTFLECFKLVDPETQWRVAADVSNYFFVIAHYNEAVDQSTYEIERDFAQDFMGKYHVFIPNLNSRYEREFFEDYVFYKDSQDCGNRHLRNDNRISYEFLGDTGGNSLYYFNGLGLSDTGDQQTLADLPFARFLKIVNNNEGGGFGGLGNPFKMVVVEKGGQDFFPANVSAEANTSTIFPNSGNNWFIQDDALKNQAHTYQLKALPQATNEYGENIVRLILNSQGANIDRNKIYVFLGYKAGKDAFQYQRGNAYHPLAKEPVLFNGDPLNLEIDPTTHLPKTDVVYRYPELRCFELGENPQAPCYMGHFTTPVCQFEFYFPTYGYYRVILQKTRKVLKRIAKYESVRVTGNCDSGRTLSLIVDPISITDEDITKFKKIGPNTCVWDTNKIFALHDIYSRNLGTSQNTPLIKKTFTVAGVANNTLGINDGLQNISISADEQGVRSTYTFGTTHFLVPDDPLALVVGQGNVLAPATNINIQGGQLSSS